MLCSFPSRAQPPIVDVVKWTFAPASMALASASVIQSVADGIDQSPLGVELSDLDGASELPDEEPPLPALEPVDVSLFEPDVVVVSDESSRFELPDPEPVLPARRSFLAQPDPLKWIAGAAKTLRTGPLPHNGQLVGPLSFRPWMTSNRRPQAEQT